MGYDIAGRLRNLQPGNIDDLRGPYATLSDANLAIPNNLVGGVSYRMGKFVEIGTKAPYATYWWKDGYEDANLVVYIPEPVEGYTADQTDIFGIADTKGNVGFKIDGSGNAIFNELAAQFRNKLIQNGFPVNADGLIDVSSLELFTASVSNEYAITDINGNISLKIDSAGNAYFKESLEQFKQKLLSSGFVAKQDGTLDLSVFNLMSGDNPDVFVVCDQNGYIGLKLSSTGLDYVGTPNTGSGASTGTTTVLQEGNYPSDVAMIATYGQSNATGNSFTSGDVSSNVLGFTRGADTDGAVTQYDAVTAKSLTALDAFYGSDFSSVTYGTASQTEAAMHQFLKMVISENAKDLSKIDFSLCGSNPSQGGTQIEVLTYVSGINIYDNPAWALNDGIVWTQDASPNGANALYMARLLQSVWYAKKFADKVSKTFSVPVLSFIHGEAHQNDLTYQTYYNSMVVAFDLINSLIKKITGQPDDVKFLVFQTAVFLSPTSIASGILDSISMAQLQIAKDKANVFYSFSMLPFESTATDYIHYLQVAYSLMGVYTGIQAKRIVVDNIDPTPIVPLSFTTTKTIQGTYLLAVKYKVPQLPLAFDSTQPFFQSSNRKRGVRPNYGFSLKKILYVSEEIPSATLYTKATAIVAVPVRLRKNGLVIKIRVSDSAAATAVYEYYQFSGDYTNATIWNNASNWTALTGVSEAAYELLKGVNFIKIRRDDTIVFECSENPKGYFLKYGYEPLSDTTGGGNLRDSQGDTIKTFVAGSTYTFNNWSPIHKLEII